MNRRDAVLALLIGGAIVAAIGAATNHIDIRKFSWDFNQYIALAEHGFDTNPLKSPFAYRYGTPFLAALLARVSEISITEGFTCIAYAGAVLQLFSVFLLVRWLSRSPRAAYVAMFVTALSMFNVKFLLFDVYRPDHLAYPLVTAAFYLALTNQFLLLILTTAIGVQFREFVLVPLGSYLLAIAIHDRSTLRRVFWPSFVCIALAVVLPRVLIHVSSSDQYVTLSLDGFKNMIKIPFNIKRDLNLVYSVVAYLLPSLMLSSPARLKVVRERIPRNLVLVMGSYALLVLVLALYGGSDLTRFVTYLFLPQAILIGFLYPLASTTEVLLMLSAVAGFNRIWMTIPTWNLDAYLDFYGGYSTRLNVSTVMRVAEIAACVLLSILVRRIRIKEPVPEV